MDTTSCIHLTSFSTLRAGSPTGRDRFCQPLRPRSCCLFDLVSPLIHARPEKFEAVHAARTGHFMVITELRKDRLDLISIAHFSWGQGLEALDGLRAGR